MSEITIQGTVDYGDEPESCKDFEGDGNFPVTIEVPDDTSDDKEIDKEDYSGCG